MNQQLSISSPFYKRFNAWAKERFPMNAIISGVLSYITMTALGQQLVEKPVDIALADILGAMAFTGHFFILRVFDEHKDYSVDLINHPQRALQRGLITLSHLRAMAIFWAVVAVVWSFFKDGWSFGVSTALWVATMTYSLLMAKEFFAKKYLHQTPIILALSHLLVSPLMMYWILCTASGSFLCNKTIILIMGVSLTSGILFELTRKCRGPEEESETLDSYSKWMGREKTMAIIIVCNLIFFALMFFLLSQLTDAVFIPLVIMSLGFSCTFYPNYNFLKQPSLKARKLNEGGLGLYLLGAYAALLFILFGQS